MKHGLQEYFVETARQVADPDENQLPSETESKCARLGEIFSKASSEGPAFDHLKKTTTLFGGQAISPSSAAGCIEDLQRSIKFIQAGYLATKKALEKFEDRPIRVLEIGSGPYAPIATTLASLFPQGEVEFMALDIYEVSISCAKKVAEVLGQNNKYREDGFIVADATQIILPEEHRPHVSICETMFTALEDEPQIAITANLADQMVEGGFFLPEQVRVSALIKEKPGNKYLGDIYVLDRSIAERVKTDGVLDPIKVEAEMIAEKIFHTDTKLSKTGNYIIVETRVKIFENIMLEPGESNITATFPVYFKGKGKALTIGVKTGLGIAGGSTIKKVVSSDSENPCGYDKNWINSHRLSSFWRFLEKLMPPGYPR